MSRTVRMALIGVALIAIIALAWFFLLSPIREDIASTATQIEDARGSLAAAQAKLAQAEITRQEGKKNQSRLIELAKMVPADQEIPSLLVQIQDLAVQSGIEFMSITPGAPLEQVDYRVIPMSVEFTGTYFDLSDFIYRAEQMVAAPGRLLTIKNMNLELSQTTAGEAVTGAVSPLLHVAMTMYAYDTAVSELAVSVPATPPADAASDSGGQ